MRPYRTIKFTEFPDIGDIQAEGRASHVGRFAEKGGDYKPYIRSAKVRRAVRRKLAQLKVEFDVGRLLTYRVALVIDEGHAPNIEASMAKMYSTAFEQRLARTAMDILGPAGLLMEGSKHVPINGLGADSYLASKGYSLQAGTSEILKNIIAQRGLGLPT